MFSLTTDLTMQAQVRDQASTLLQRRLLDQTAYRVSTWVWHQICDLLWRRVRNRVRSQVQNPILDQVFYSPNFQLVLVAYV